MPTNEFLYSCSCIWNWLKFGLYYWKIKLSIKIYDNDTFDAFETNNRNTITKKKHVLKLECIYTVWILMEMNSLYRFDSNMEVNVIRWW